MLSVMIGCIFCLSFAQGTGAGVVKLCTRTTKYITCLGKNVILIKEVFRVSLPLSAGDRCGYEVGDYKEYVADITKRVWKDCNMWSNCNVKDAEATWRRFVEIHYECLSKNSIRMLSICEAGRLDGNQGYIHSPRYPYPISTDQLPLRGCKCSASLAKPVTIQVKVFNTFLDKRQTLEIQWDSQKETPPAVPHYKKYTHTASTTFSVSFSTKKNLDALFWLEYRGNLPLAITCSGTESTTPKPATPKTTPAATTTPPSTTTPPAGTTTPTTKAAVIVSTPASPGVTSQPHQPTDLSTTTTQDTTSSPSVVRDSSSTWKTPPTDKNIGIVVGTVVPGVLIIIIIVTVVLLVRRRRKAARETYTTKNDDNNTEKLDLDQSIFNPIYQKEDESKPGSDEKIDEPVINGPTLYSSVDEMKLSGSGDVKGADKDTTPEEVTDGQTVRPSGRAFKLKMKLKAAAASLKAKAEKVGGSRLDEDDVLSAVYCVIKKDGEGRKAGTKGPSHDTDEGIVGVGSVAEADSEHSGSGKDIQFEMKEMKREEPKSRPDGHYADIDEIRTAGGPVDKPNLDESHMENGMSNDGDEEEPEGGYAMVGKTPKQKSQKKFEGAKKKSRVADESAAVGGAVYAEVVKKPRKRPEEQLPADKTTPSEEEAEQIDVVYAEVDRTSKPKYRMKPELARRNIEGATDPAASPGDEYSHLQREKITKPSSPGTLNSGVDENEAGYNSPVWEDNDLYTSSSLRDDVTDTPSGGDSEYYEDDVYVSVR